MTFSLDPVTAIRWVVWGGLVLGLILGVVGQSTRFCVRGGIADYVIFGGPGRLVSWLVAIAVAMVGMQLLISLGSFDATRTLAWSDRFVWASYLVGGGLFGFGMMLSGGCPQRSLVKAGAGDLKALVVLIVTAVAALMTLRGAFSGVRVSLLDTWAIGLAGSQDAGSLLSRVSGLPAGAVRWALAFGVVAAVSAFAWRVRKDVTPSQWMGGLAVGLLVPAAFYLTGHIGFLPEHPETLEAAWLGTQSRRPEGLSFAAPLAHSLDLLTLWSDTSTVASFGVMLCLGVLVGSHVSARLRGEYQVMTFSTANELKSHLLGSVLMGFGGVTAVGCSIGNGLTHVAMLSTGAALALAGITGGALLALRVQMRSKAATPSATPAATAA